MKSKEGKFQEGSSQQWQKKKKKKVKLNGNWEKATTFDNEVISYLGTNCSF